MFDTKLQLVSHLPSTLPAETLAPPAVYIQGEQYSFHHRAAEILLPNHPTISANTFDELVEGVHDFDHRIGLLAIENSLVGALLSNYQLIEQYALRITGEIYLRISHTLMGTEDSEIVNLKQVESHPVAIAQCTQFFKEHAALKGIDTYDTAGAARIIAKANDPTRAALAPRWCAKAYGLKILQENTEDNPHNWTRFLQVSARSQPTFEGEQKVSIAFTLPNQPGTLTRALQILATNDLEVQVIHSLPVVGKPWEYRFFVDFKATSTTSIKTGLALLTNYAKELDLIGTYTPGKHYEL